MVRRNGMAMPHTIPNIINADASPPPMARVKSPSECQAETAARICVCDNPRDHANPCPTQINVMDVMAITHSAQR